MVALTVELITDASRGLQPKIRRTDKGYAGQKCYRVNTHDEGAALFAPGVPAFGEPWSNTGPLAGCVVVGLDAEYQYGTNDSANTAGWAGGWTFVRVEYATPGASVFRPPPAIGNSYTEPSPGMETVNVLFGIPDPTLVGPPDPRPIAGGNGAPKKVPTLSLTVHQYVQAGTVNLVGLLMLRGKVNQNEVSVPRVPGDLAPFYTFAPGQLFYKTPILRPGIIPEISEIVHELDAAEDFLFRWQGEDENGRAVGGENETQLYEAAVFPGLL